MCCSVLQCVTACCSVLQCAALRCSVLQLQRKLDATHCNSLPVSCYSYHWVCSCGTTQLYIRHVTHSSGVGNAATHCNSLQQTLSRHTATHHNTLLPTASHCIPLHRITAHCITLHHTATHYNVLQHTASLQHTATHCTTLHHTATHYNTLQYTVTSCCNTLQHTELRTHRCERRVKEMEQVHQKHEAQLLSHQILAQVSWCSVLQCVAVCCSVLQCVAVCCSVLPNTRLTCSHSKSSLRYYIAV